MSKYIFYKKMLGLEFFLINSSSNPNLKGCLHLYSLVDEISGDKHLSTKV